ncbi:MAG TPA: hypothetical protein PKE38_13485 [Ignavibacteriaceae bacterium]|nr:hypothetical protein [Ignavibacteriaceae bacterium]
MEILKIVVTAITVVLGWIVGHYFTSTRDRRNKKRDLTIQHLINAYTVLTNEITHRPKSINSDRALEKVISDIQLFGSIEQVEIAKSLAAEIAQKGNSGIDDLINSLRNDLRRQLKLPPIEGNITWLRFNEEK